MATLTADSIGSYEPDLQEVEIWGGEVYLCPIAGEHLKAVDDANAAHTEGTATTLEVATLILSFTMCNESREKIFSSPQEALEILGKKPFPDVMDLLDKANDASGFVSVEELEKN